jgi:hypothetical protein
MRNRHIFKNSCLFKNILKKCHLPRKLYAFIINIYPKKNHLYEKVIFGRKDMKFFSKITSLAHFISFVPIYYLLTKYLKNDLL